MPANQWNNLHFTPEFFPGHGEIIQFAIFDQVIAIVKSENGTLPAGCFDIVKRFRLPVMRFPAGQMAVIMVLVDDVDRGAAVYHLPAALTGFVDHPIIPAGPSYGKGRNEVENPSGEQEVITTSARVPPGAVFD